MAVITEEHLREQTLKLAAQKMLLAARTAPKARGTDNIICAVIDGPDIARLADKMEELGRRQNRQFMLRDASNIRRHAGAVVLIGSKIAPLGLDCGFCGWPTCAEKETHPAAPCAFNTGDLGIAVGSAACAAADFRADNRIMLSAGRAAAELGLLGPEAKIIYGIPLSATGKNPFFDRA
ncbi:MAG: DUF2148 domain-containing protein [Elusimicrobiales bacterium]